MSEIDATVENAAKDADAAAGAGCRVAPPLPGELGRWRTVAYGDDRDDLRAALSAGTDAVDDLVAIGVVLGAMADEDTALDRETQQRALDSAARLLRERVALLDRALGFLWARAQADERIAAGE